MLLILVKILISFASKIKAFLFLFSKLFKAFFYFLFALLGKKCKKQFFKKLPCRKII